MDDEMKKEIFFCACFILLLFSQCNQEKLVSAIGIGVMDYTRMAYDRMTFYESPEGKVKHVISFRDRASNDHFTKQKWFSPRAGDAITLNYTCLENKNPWYKVVVNESTHESCWLKDTSAAAFTNWESFIGSVVIVRTLDSNAAIYQRPDSHSEIITFRPPIVNRSVMAVDGEWMKVAYFTGDTDRLMLGGGERVPLGWIRWRTEDQLLIDYDELP